MTRRQFYYFWYQNKKLYLLQNYFSSTVWDCINSNDNSYYFLLLGKRQNSPTLKTKFTLRVEISILIVFPRFLLPFT